MKKTYQFLLVVLVLFIGVNIIHASQKLPNEFKVTYCGMEDEWHVFSYEGHGNSELYAMVQYGNEEINQIGVFDIKPSLGSCFPFKILSWYIANIDNKGLIRFQVDSKDGGVYVSVEPENAPSHAHGILLRKEGDSDSFADDFSLDSQGSNYFRFSTRLETIALFLNAQ